MSFRVIGLAAIAAFGLTVPASADVLYDNLGATSTGQAMIQAGPPPLADSFSTGATGFALSEVTIVVADATPSDGASFTVSLLSDNSTSPGSLLDTLGIVLDSSVTTSLSQVALTLSTPYDLTADTTYWIELAGVTSAHWSQSTDISGTGVAGQYFESHGGVFPSTDGPFQMEVSGSELSTVPEPASLSLLGAALIGFGVLRRRRKRI